MTKLKTLKDIKGRAMSTEVALVSTLKAEAVKWIKEDIDLIMCNGEAGELQQIVKDIFIERWKNRFNITEEELAK